MKPLALSLAVGAGWEYVRPWVTSLRQTGYAGPAVLVTIDCETGLHEQCAQWDVATIERDAAELATRHLHDVITGRHNVLSNVLRDKFEDHFVISCDVRDVFFQRDPFEFFGPDLREADAHKLYVVSEETTFDQDTSVPAMRWNGVKVAQLFSRRERLEMTGKPVYNAGVLCGAAPFLADAMRMVYLLCFNTAVPVGDQAALNVMLQTEPHRSHAVLLGFDDGWVVHFASARMGLVPDEVKPRVEDGLVKTAGGQPFAIVHQYDRSQALRALVEERLEVTG